MGGGCLVYPPTPLPDVSRLVRRWGSHCWPLLAIHGRVPCCPLLLPQSLLPAGTATWTPKGHLRGLKAKATSCPGGTGSPCPHMQVTVLMG